MSKHEKEASRREKGSSIVRVLEIMEAVALSNHPLSVTDLAFQLDIPKATTHRLVQTLEAEGFLQTNMRGNLVVADRMHRLSLNALYTGRYKAERRAILEKLSTQVGETCGIAIPDGTEMIYYDRIQANWPLQVHLPIGSRVPAWCTASGKLYLSTLPKAKVKRILASLAMEPVTRNTIADPERLMAHLIETYERQYGTDNEEFIDGMCACSVPVFNDEGRMVAGLFCHAPIIRKTLDQLLDYLPIMREAANELSMMISNAEKNRIEQ
jgi:IclR family acetate operon transcriptional repressor